MVYRYCIVPGCKSTTISTPGKTFIKLPIEEKQRKIWLKAMRRQPEDISLKSHVYLCEDHFNLEQDMENYMEWKMMGVQKRMKKNVVPHIFACQEDKKRTYPQPERMAVVKRARQRIIQDVLCEASSSSTSKSDLRDVTTNGVAFSCDVKFKGHGRNFSDFKIEKNFNENTLAPVSKDMNNLLPNSVSKEARNINTRQLSAFVIKHEEIENCSNLEPYLGATKEHEDPPHVTLVENNINTPTVKIQPDRDHSEVQHFSSDTFEYMWVKLEPEIVPSEGNVILKNQECILNSSDTISSSNLNGSPEFPSKPLQMLLKTENSDSKTEIDKMSRVVYDDWKIKNEEIDLTDKGLIENENKSSEFSSTQLMISVKTENSEAKSEIENWPDIVYDDWKIKDEEVDLKEEDLLEIDSQSMLSGNCNQEKPDDYKEYKCHVCDYQTERTSNLQQHLLKHRKLKEVELFRCKRCEYVTRYKRALKRHVLRHKNLEEIDVFKCDSCEYVTRFKDGLKRHLLRHKDPEKVNLFGCDKCEYRTPYNCELKKHQLKHKEPEEVVLYRCDQCDHVTRYKNALKRHALGHKNPETLNLFKCDKCDYVTRFKDTLKKHVLGHKNPEEVDLFRCDRCEYVTRYRGDLKKHILRHKNPKQVDLFRCDKCEYVTRFKDRVKQHALKHTNPEEVNLFGCDKCEYRTRYKGELKKHQLKHKTLEEVALLKCDKCEYMTDYRSALNRHILGHKNPEEVDLFRCDKCEYVTRFKDAFKKHLLRHKNSGKEDLFKCDKCEYQTYFKHYLKKHFLKHNNP